MLTVTGLTKIFKGTKRSDAVTAIGDLNLELNQGEFLTLLGPIGCGKTTTLRCVAGLERADKGEISIGGRVMYSQASRTNVPSNQRNIGMVFQSYAIWPHMDVFENVAFPLRVGKKSISKPDLQERVHRVLDIVGLAEIPNRYATNLSGGQQQRLAFARALVIEPDLLLLDEPLSNLDAKLRESLRFELKRLQRDQGITTLYVTHDQTEALSLSNRIAVMSEGKLMQVGKPFDIYLKPQGKFVADFVGNTNFLEATYIGNATVETAIGKLQIANTEGLHEGQHCTISIRPEHIELDEVSGPDKPNSFDGEIETRLFIGEAMDYQVTIGDTRIRTKGAGAIGDRFSSGQAVKVVFPVERCVTLTFKP